jgi:ABC-type transporter Mla subunit MlaD
MEGTAETQESISSHIRELLSASSGIKSAAKDLETIFSRTNDVMQQTVKVSELLESSSSSLSEAQLEFKDIAFRNFEETKSYLDTHLNSFEQLKTQTSSLFEEINKGINTYQTGASASINQYLGDFANELEGAANSLSGAYTSLNDTIEEIGDLFEKINNKKN